MDKGLFQVDLAGMLGVDEMTIVNCEKGNRRPRGNTQSGN
jgi:DNA-binding XRE family transcriptional regulator